MSGAALIDDEAQTFEVAIPPQRSASVPAPLDPVGAAFVQGPQVCHSYQASDWRTRLVGAGGTSAVLLIFAAAAFLRLHAAPAMIAAPQPLTVVNLERLEAPTAPVREVPEGPEQVQRDASPPRPREKLPELERPPLFLPGYSAPRPPEQASAAEPVAETSAPRSVPAPPASRAATNVTATWQALLLAHLEKYRRYPAAARSRGQQGVAQVTFRMNRQGRLLSSHVSRSSGSAMLDRAAIDTLKRAQPLPTIPDDMPAEIELAVDVEFFTR